MICSTYVCTLYWSHGDMQCLINSTEFNNATFVLSHFFTNWFLHIAISTRSRIKIVYHATIVYHLCIILANRNSYLGHCWNPSFREVKLQNSDRSIAIIQCTGSMLKQSRACQFANKSFLVSNTFLLKYLQCICLGIGATRWLYNTSYRIKYCWTSDVWSMACNKKIFAVFQRPYKYRCTYMHACIVICNTTKNSMQ